MPTHRWIYAFAYCLLFAAVAKAQTVIDVGTWTLQPNLAGQVVQLTATPGDQAESVTGFNLRAQIGDGTAPGSEPVFSSIDFLTDTFWPNESTVIGGPVLDHEQFAQSSVIINQTGVTQFADGLIATLTIDTTGFDSGSFPLLLSSTEIGAPSVFIAEGGADIIPSILNGTLFIGALTCGDFDQDGDVDSADRTTVTQNWTGALAAGEGDRTFAQGDCDADGDVDTADQTGLTQNWTGAAMGAGNIQDRGGHADLVYNPASGNVTLDATETNSRALISFVLGSDQQNMRTENTSFPFFDVGTNTDNQPFQIGQTDPLNQGAGPLIDLGDVFPTGMTVEALSDYLTLAEYASELGSGGELDLVVVPEPSALLLLSLAALSLPLMRRRRR